MQGGGGMTEKEAGLLNPLQLAYLGDTVWDMLIRSELIRKRFNVHHMHLEAVKYVSARGQTACLQRIQERLTETEAEVVRRGRNAHAKHPAPKNQDPGDYAAATGFEALLGYWYLTGQEERILFCLRLILEGEEHG